jgi:hypothetical protein
LPDVRMMMTKNYYSKVDDEVSYRLSDVRMIMTRNYYSKVDDKYHADIVGCSYDDVKELLWLNIENNMECRMFA